MENLKIRNVLLFQLMVRLSVDVHVPRNLRGLRDYFQDATETLFEKIEEEGIRERELFYGIIIRPTLRAQHQFGISATLATRRVWTRAHFIRLQEQWVNILERVYDEDGFVNDSGLASGDLEVINEGWLNRAAFEHGRVRVILVASSPYV
jgi:hypothetical protein